MKKVALAPPCQDMHLTNAQRQGDWTNPTMITPILVKIIRERIHTDPLERNPALDLTGTGNYHIQVGLKRREGSPPLSHEHSLHLLPTRQMHRVHAHLQATHAQNGIYDHPSNLTSPFQGARGGTIRSRFGSPAHEVQRNTCQGKDTPDSETLTLNTQHNGSHEGQCTSHTREVCLPPGPLPTHPDLLLQAPRRSAL